MKEFVFVVPVSKIYTRKKPICVLVNMIETRCTQCTIVSYLIGDDLL